MDSEDSQQPSASATAEAAYLAEVRRATDAIEPYTVCLYKEDQPGIATRAGSGVLFQIADVHLLLTARHVLIGLMEKPGTPCWIVPYGDGIGWIPLVSSKQVWTRGVNQQSNATEDERADVIDIAALVLNEQTFSPLKLRSSFLRCHQIDRCVPRLNDPRYIALGFPKEYTRVYAEGSFSKSTPLALYGALHTGAEGALGEYSSNANLSINVDIPEALLTPGAPKETIGQERPVKLHGISGCGIWHMHGESAPQLVAIQHTWLEHAEAITGTTLPWVLQMLHDECPSLRAPMAITFVDLPMVQP